MLGAQWSKATGLVEDNGIIEHLIHVLHRGGLPVSQRLVEANCSAEHAPHRGHLRGVPGAHGLTKAFKESVPSSTAGSAPSSQNLTCCFKAECPQSVP